VKIHVSLTHEKDNAIAMVVLETPGSVGTMEIPEKTGEGV